MSDVLILYSTVDGHTLKICRRLLEIAAQSGRRATLVEMRHAAGIDLPQFESVVIGASVRYGHHRSDVVRYMRVNREALEARQCAFFSVSIIARKPDKSTPENNPYVRKFLAQIGWRPRHLAVFAGRLDYPAYGFWDRNIIRLIMLLTRGPTDPRVAFEFTDWGQVDSFGRAIDGN